MNPFTGKMERPFSKRKTWASGSSLSEVISWVKKICGDSFRFLRAKTPSRKGSFFQKFIAMDMGTCLILIFNRVLNSLIVLRWSTSNIFICFFLLT